MKCLECGGGLVLPGPKVPPIKVPVEDVRGKTEVLPVQGVAGSKVCVDCYAVKVTRKTAAGGTITSTAKLRGETVILLGGTL